MSRVVCPISNVSTPDVKPLNATPATAVPPSVNGTVTVSVTWLNVLPMPSATYRRPASRTRPAGPSSPVAKVGTAPAGVTLLTVLLPVLAT